MARLLVPFLVVGSAAAFAPIHHQIASRSGTTELRAFKLEEAARKAAASLAVAGTILANVVVEPAVAFTSSGPADFGGGSSQVIAARSGGRAGGRAAARAAPPSSTARRTEVVVRERTTIVQPAYSPTVAVVAPPVYSYGPTGGDIALGLGLSAVSGIANGMREARQESEIAQGRAELNAERMKAAELEARLRQLEMAQYAK